MRTYHVILNIVFLFSMMFSLLSVAASPDGQEDICSDPEVLMCDNFEGRSVGNSSLSTKLYKNEGWAVSNTGVDGPQVISNPVGVFSGSRSLQMTYPAGQNTGGGFMDLNWGGNNRTIYYRWYTKFSSNFKWSYVATKHNEIITGNGHTHHIMWFPSGGGTSKAPSNAFGYAGFFPSQNTSNGTLTMVPDKWYCQEMRITMNSTGATADGGLEGWIDGVKHFDYNNVVLDSSNPGGIVGTLVSGYWNCYSGGGGSESCTDANLDSHPLMYRWHDNFVVSTKPIGCIGATPPPVNTKVPMAPKNLRIK